MPWTVHLTRQAAKQYRELPETVRSILDALIMEIKAVGPVRGNWKNYGKLGVDFHHCHLKAGRPTYVACWSVNKKSRIVEVTYAGTHEKAPY